MTSKYRFPWAGVLLTFLSLSAHAALPTAVGGKPGYALCLRLLDRAVRYLEDPSPRVLLTLPAEERRILVELLEIDSPREGGPS